MPPLSSRRSRDGHGYPTTSLYGVTTQKTTLIFITMKISHHAGTISNYNTAPINSMEQRPLVHVLSHMTPFHTLPSYFSKIHSNIILPFMFRCSKWSLAFTFSDQNVIFLTSSMLLHAPPIQPF